MKRNRPKPSEQRCQLSQRGREALRYLNPDIRGTIVDETPSRRAWRVLWDQNTWPVVLHKGYVEVLDEAVAA